LNKEVPEHALAVARAKQRNVEGWGKRRQASKDAKKKAAQKEQQDAGDSGEQKGK
jgi:hypothetical protein